MNKIGVAIGKRVGAAIGANISTTKTISEEDRVTSLERVRLFLKEVIFRPIEFTIIGTTSICKPVAARR